MSVFESALGLKSAIEKAARLLFSDEKSWKMVGKTKYPYGSFLDAVHGPGNPCKRTYEIEAFEDSRISSGLCVIPVSRRSGIMTHHVKAAIQGETGFLLLLTCAEKLFINGTQ